MSQVDEHRAFTNPDGTDSSRSTTSNEFSLDGLPEGSASDLIGFAEQFGGLRRER